MQPQLSTSKVITVPDVLFSYLYSAQPKKNTDPKTGKVNETYEVDGVFPSTHPAFALVRDAQREVAKAAWGEVPTQFPYGTPDPNTGQAAMVTLPNWEGVLRGLQQENKIPLRDGNRRNKPEEPYTGNFYLAARLGAKPGVAPRVVVTRGGVNVEIKPDDPQYPYSGARGNLVVEIWAQGANGKPSPYGRRINCAFKGVQFLAHGNRFGGGARVASMEEFGICPADADAPAPSGEAPGAPSLI
jgi:hypothetical protein